MIEFLIWVFSAFVAIALVGGILMVVGHSKADDHRKDRRAVLNAQSAANHAFATAALADHVEPQILFIDNQRCLAAITSDTLAIEAYPLFETKPTDSADKIVVALETVLSLEWGESAQLRRVLIKEKEAVLVHHRRSPVARGLASAALLGPVGGVLGAASGLNGKTELKHVEKKVTKYVETSGPRSILIGTSDLSRPVVRVRAPSASKTEEWFYRLRATIAA